MVEPTKRHESQKRERLSYFIYCSALLALLYVVHEPDDAGIRAQRFPASAVTQKKMVEQIEPSRDYPPRSEPASAPKPLTVRDIATIPDSSTSRMRTPQRRLN
jgi:hypothetical protein